MYIIHAFIIHNQLFTYPAEKISAERSAEHSAEHFCRNRTCANCVWEWEWNVPDQIKLIWFQFYTGFLSEVLIRTHQVHTYQIDRYQLIPKWNLCDLLILWKINLIVKKIPKILCIFRKSSRICSLFALDHRMIHHFKDLLITFQTV